MKLQTTVAIEKTDFKIRPTDKILFVGSCFAAEMGNRFSNNCFDVIVNPYGTMYNPASILHTIERLQPNVDLAVLTLGTNHVYLLNETGEIVDNCQKRPAKLFTEKKLSIDECREYLDNAINILRSINERCNVILTVSPIRYQKYGFHESQVSKATLLLAVDKICAQYSSMVHYFPAYEIMCDELRDYRFYKPDMLHPSEQAVDYIFESFCKASFDDDTFSFMEEWQPIRKALSHKPSDPDSEEYQQFWQQTKEQETSFRKKWRLSD